MTSLAIFILSFSVALIVSAACSVAESVLLSLSTPQIVEISKRNPRVGAIWESFKKDMNPPITSILTLNTTAHTIGASFAGASFAQLFGDNWVGLFSIGFTFLMLQYTEILPKTLGIRFNKRLAFFIARPLCWATIICDPLVRLLRLFNRPFEPNEELKEGVNAVKEITLLTSLARSRSQIDPEQEKIILATLKLSKTAVSDVMVPMVESSVLSDNMSLQEAYEAAQNDSHTRFPVCYGNNREIIVGYVNFKELVAPLRSDEETRGSEDASHTCLANYVRKIVHVEPTAKASDVLNLLVKNHDHIALVVNSQEKQNLGLLTLEDLVEELVGEIEDEFDRLPTTLREQNDGVRVGGGALMVDLCESVRRVFPEEAESFLSELGDFGDKKRLSDWIESKIPDALVRNTRVDCGELTITVRRVRRGQVFDAEIQRKRLKEETPTPSTKGV